MNRTWKKKDAKSTYNGEGSLQPMGQVVTSHQTKQKEVCGTDIQKFYHTLVPNNSSTKEDKIA